MGKDKLYIAYYRVSTARQGASGLGLEAQQKAVRDFLNGNGCRIVAEYTEVESGKRPDRPELAKALTECRLRGAVLVIAKMDRLARNVAFVSNLMDSGVDFIAVDFPQANRLTVHILAAVAEHEARAISDRTKAALAAAKARGTKLGNPANLTDAGRKRGTVKGNASKAKIADDRAAMLLPIVDEIRAQGATSLRAIAAALNERGVPGAQGGKWYASNVRLLLKRRKAS